MSESDSNSQRRTRRRKSRAKHKNLSRADRFQGDRHFDQLAQPLMNNIYGSYKGRLRLALLRDDLWPLLESGQTVLDVGAGLAQLSAESQSLGLEAFAIDAAQEMRSQANEYALEHFAFQWQERYMVTTLQDYEAPADGFDWVWCHAVLAWLAEPAQGLRDLVRCLRPGGRLSLLFYNRDSIALQQIFRGRFDYLEKLWTRQEAQSDTQGVAESDIVKPFYPGGLTPQTPLASQWVCDQLHALGLQVSWLRGVRCFADYLQANVRSRMTEEQLLAIERTYRTEMPYRQMARYIHLLAVKPPTDVSSEQ